jgi:hypothetical protein
MKRNNYSLMIINSILLILIISILFYTNIYKNDYFSNNPSTTNPLTTSPQLPQPIDRTKLYGSLFLDNLDKSIKNMSNPDIKYENKRIELNNYSDILL